MTVYMVWVSDHESNRWLDSQWADKQHAEDRKAELKASMDACIRVQTKHAVFITVGSVADAALVDTATAIAKAEGRCGQREEPKEVGA